MALILHNVTSTIDIGRPRKNFGDLCPKAQTKKVANLVQESTCEQLLVVTSSSLYKSGMRSASKIVCSLNNDEKSGQNIKQSFETSLLKKRLHSILM